MLTNLRLSAFPELALPADIPLPFLCVRGDVCTPHRPHPATPQPVHRRRGPSDFLFYTYGKYAPVECQAHPTLPLALEVYSLTASLNALPAVPRRNVLSVDPSKMPQCVQRPWIRGDAGSTSRPSHRHGSPAPRSTGKISSPVLSLRPALRNILQRWLRAVPSLLSRRRA